MSFVYPPLRTATSHAQLQCLPFIYIYNIIYFTLVLSINHSLGGRYVMSFSNVEHFKRTKKSMTGSNFYCKNVSNVLGQVVPHLKVLFIYIYGSKIYCFSEIQCPYLRQKYRFYSVDINIQKIFGCHLSHHVNFPRSK